MVDETVQIIIGYYSRCIP